MKTSKSPDWLSWATKMRRMLPRRRLVSTPGVDARLVLDSFANGPGRRGPFAESAMCPPGVSTTSLPHQRDRTCIVYHADSKTFVIGTRRSVDYSIIRTVFNDGFDYRRDILFKYRVLSLGIFDNATCHLTCGVEEFISSVSKAMPRLTSREMDCCRVAGGRE